MKDGFSTYEEHYENVRDVVVHNVRHFKQHSEYIENALEELAENGPPESVWDAVVPAIEEDNVAARNVLTLHAPLQLSQNNHLSYEKKAILVNYLSQLKVLACDEISMVGSPHLADMNS